MRNDDSGEKATLLERVVSGLSLAAEVIRVPAAAVYQAVLVNVELIGRMPLGYLSYTHAMARKASQRIGRNHDILRYGVKPSGRQF